MTLSPITPPEYRQMLESAKQVAWSAEVSLSMFMLSQDHPWLRVPLLWLHKVLMAYAHWHYCRANRIYAKVTADD
jgi:hypothetical protein